MRKKISIKPINSAISKTVMDLSNDKGSITILQVYLPTHLHEKLSKLKFEKKCKSMSQAIVDILEKNL